MNHESLWRIFVSHSAGKTKGVAARLLRDLEGAFGPNYTVWTDKSIGAGTEWRPEIEYWLRAADFGVLLLDAKAVVKEWPAREYNWLRASAQHKEIFAVLIGITKRELDENPDYRHFSDLLDFQVLEVQESEEDGKISESVSAALTWIAGQLPSLDTGSREEYRTIKELAGLFTMNDREADELIGLHFPELAEVHTTGAVRLQTRERLAELLIRAQLSKQVAAAVSKLSLAEVPDRRLVAIIAPTWLTFDEAVELRVTGDSPRIPAITSHKNSTRKQLAKDYLARAFHCRSGYHFVEFDPIANGGRNAIAAQVARLFLDFDDEEGDSPAMKLACVHGAGTECEQDEPQYVLTVADSLHPTIDAVREIHNRCRKVIVVLALSTKLPLDAGLSARLGARYLPIPLVPVQRQKEAESTMIRIESDLKKRGVR
ncbi:toll/interleukin-1 receptor domain-containing protein [Amycolatopsis speibonae]|uniref:Toll/interleukin-1 receptor domain-containing protein n=1 Tax=Amycolatopsis speibonae TaxID=1450224 RepID=A0ABV7P5A8_9PSEU